MAEVKIEYVVFWLLIAMIVAIVIWKLFGSPTDMATFISILTLITASEIVIWKTLFKIENKATIGFMKIKNRIDSLEHNINDKFNNIENLMRR